MDVQAANLLATLRRTAAPAEQKLTLLSNIKSDIKHYRVPENAQATIFECLKLAISSQTSINLVTAALSTLGHLIKRLKIQDAEGRAITSLAPRLWPTLQDRLGDPRDSHRAGAQQALIDLYPFCAGDIEHLIRDEAIGGQNTRAKELGMQWVVRMHDEQALPFKSFVPAMVTCLEDADGMVRDAAKASLVDLFRTASTPAKNDLKKQLKLHAVRQSIASQILSQIGVSDRPAPEVDLHASTRSLPTIDHLAHFSESLNSEEARPPPPEEVPMDPIFVNSRQELEDMFRDMLPHFEGRESEDNWLLRDKNTMKLRRLTKGNAPSDYHAAYMTGIKQMQEGTLKVANSLRTTMMTNGCQFVQELARTLGPAMDSMVETYLQHFVKMCAATKSIQVQNGNNTVDTILQYVSYNIKLSQHVWLAAQDKNKSPRVFSAGWLRTILSRQAGSRTHFEHVGGLDLAEKTIKKCLTDADPKVKESMRATYWAYAKLWPDKAEAMINAFDDKVRTALERDSHNPNATNMQSSFSQSTTSRASGARSALRDRIAAAKREKAQPGRPNTAMATMSPAKSRSMANLSARAKAMAPPSSRVVSNASVASTATIDSVASTASTSTVRPNSLMSGAARRPVKRPEIARPATADPYATRRVHRPETPSNRSPNQTPRQSTTSKPTATQSTIARNRVGRLGSPAASPLRNNTAKPVIDSRPASRDATDHSEDSGRLNADDMTMVLPSAVTRPTASSAAKQRPPLETALSYDTAVQGLGIEDDFTLVLPSTSTSSSHNADRPLSSHRSPMRLNPEEAPATANGHNHRSSLRVASPSSTRSKSPLEPSPRRDTPQTDLKPPSRQGSPLKHASGPESPEVKIYEDPFSSQPSAPSLPSELAPQVLTELPVNETSPPAPADQLSPPASPQSKSERLRNRKLLQSGVARIKARTLDTHGFRKVAELTRTNAPADLFGAAVEEEEHVPRLYAELMGALCEFVSVGPGSTPALDRPGRVGAEIKRQAFGVLRGLVRGEGEYRVWNEGGEWYKRGLEAALRGRRWVEGTGMVVKDIEGVCADVLGSVARHEVVEGCVGFLDEQKKQAGEEAFTYPDIGPEGKEGRSKGQASALALRCVTSALGGDAEGISDEQMGTLAGLVAAFLKARDAEVRKAAVECATELYAAWPAAAATNGHTNGHAEHETNGIETNGEGIVSKAIREKEGFWAALEGERGLADSTKNLIVYFVARREGRLEGR
ncbi:Protein stu-1 [Sphaceloma murrayae]|uniref:Protein stu-1 n=1 Tax=Sphaceloma murrayae TaxID=2082308 RepID=A0A2K1QP31_9PEZI|nr:Protein stu-1 [Sphaceloma murrayae]